MAKQIQEYKDQVRVVLTDFLDRGKFQITN